MNAQGLSFDELAGGHSDDAPEEEAVMEQKGMMVTINVAGPKEHTEKTIVISRDNHGLMRLKFKEGGQMPALLTGRFTDIDSVKIALATYQEREAKSFALDEKVVCPLPGAGDNGLDDALKEAMQGAAPKFPEKLDVAFDKEGEGFSEGDTDTGDQE